MHARAGEFPSLIVHRALSSMRDVCAHAYLDPLAENEALNRIEITANSLCRLVPYADGTPLGPIDRCISVKRDLLVSKETYPMRTEHHLVL